MQTIDNWHQQAKEVRLDQRAKDLRQLILRALRAAQRGHLGPSFSPLEIVRVLYDDILHYRASEPNWSQRDRFILSKGHGCLAQYALLVDKGFIPTAELDRFCSFDALLGGHPEASKVPGIELSTGSLGHGLPVGVGMALAARMQQRDSRIYVLMGDGETNEGSVWEAAMIASKHQLSNLTVLIDYNKIQSAGRVADISAMEPMLHKWNAFGFSTAEVNGHDTNALLQILKNANLNQPRAIICHTVKGKGFGFCEDNPEWHHASKIDNELQQRLQQALEEA